MPRTLWNSFNAFDCKQWNLQAMHEMHEIQLEDQSPWHSYILIKNISTNKNHVRSLHMTRNDMIRYIYYIYIHTIPCHTLLCYTIIQFNTLQ